MLVLSRKIGEAIVIGDSIVITVNRTAGNRVTLGIEAPNDVRVLRSELTPEAGSLPIEPRQEPMGSDRMRLVAR